MPGPSRTPTRRETWRGLKRSVGYRILKLAWSRPPDADFDYVRVLVAKGSGDKEDQPRTSVYKGSGTRYTDKRFENGTYHRYAIISYDHAGNASRGISVVVQPSVLLRFPRDGAVVHAPPRLVWDKVANATFYNVQLYLRGQKDPERVAECRHTRPEAALVLRRSALQAEDRDVRLVRVARLRPALEEPIRPTARSERVHGPLRRSDAVLAFGRPRQRKPARCPRAGRSADR